MPPSPQPAPTQVFDFVKAARPRVFCFCLCRVGCLPFLEWVSPPQTIPYPPRRRPSVTPSSRKKRERKPRPRFSVDATRLGLLHSSTPRLNIILRLGKEAGVRHQPFAPSTTQHLRNFLSALVPAVSSPIHARHTVSTCFPVPAPSCSHPVNTCKTQCSAPPAIVATLRVSAYAPAEGVQPLSGHIPTVEISESG